MTDVRITYNGELMVAGIDGESDAGVDFVDAYVPADPSRLVVADAGRIVLPESELAAVRSAAQAAGLAVEEVPQ